MPFGRLGARYSALKRSDQLRTIGWVVLAVGLAAALMYYGISVRPAEQPLDEILSGYSREEQHQIGVQMGTFGLVLLGWQKALERPDVRAALIAAGFALLAGYFFRSAWVLDDGERDADRQ